MRTKSEFLVRIREYGFQTYAKSCQSIGDNSDFHAFSVVTAVKDGFSTDVLWQTKEPAIPDEKADCSIMLIGDFSKHIRLLTQIMWGLDMAEE